MKKIVPIAVAALLATTLLSGCGEDEKPGPGAPPLAGQVFGDPGAGAVPQDRISQLPPDSLVATVNGEGLTAGQVNQEMNRIIAQIARNNNLPMQQFVGLRPMMIGQAVENLINQALLLQAINNSEVVVEETEIAEELEKIPPEIREQALANGIDEATIRENVVQAIKIRKMLGEIEISDEEVSEFYNENPDRFTQPESVAVRHILLAYAGAERSTATRSQEEARALAEQLLASLRAGEASFPELAAANSDCPSKSDGGKLGDTVIRGSMVPEFEEAAFSLETGVVSEVVETPFGYHLILVEEHSPASTASLEEVAEGLKQSLVARSQMEALNEMMGSLREKASISYEPGFQPPPPPETTEPALPGETGEGEASQPEGGEPAAVEPAPESEPVPAVSP